MSDSVRPHGWQPTRLLRPRDSPGKNTGVGCHFLLQCMKVKSESGVAQSCTTLHDPMDCSLPGSSVHGIFQARVLEWGAIAFSGVKARSRWRMNVGGCEKAQCPRSLRSTFKTCNFNGLGLVCFVCLVWHSETLGWCLLKIEMLGHIWDLCLPLVQCKESGFWSPAHLDLSLCSTIYSLWLQASQLSLLWSDFSFVKSEWQTLPCWLL